MNVGDIYWVNLDPVIRNETQKKRPVVLLNGGHAKHLRLAIVVPVTAWRPSWKNHPFFVTLEPNDQNGLQKKSVVDCYQPRAVSHERFHKRIGTLPASAIDRIKTAVALILDIEPFHCE